MHKMTFHSQPGDVLFFSQWILHGRKETYLACLLIVVLGIVYQGIKFARQQYGRKCHNMACRRYILSKGHLLQTVLYVIQFVWGYILMLAVMTYNLWILAATLVGFGLGYFFFGWGEYEEHSSMLRVRSTGRTCAERTCGSTSNSTTQELLPLSESTDEMIGRDIGAGEGYQCHCGENKL